MKREDVKKEAERRCEPNFSSEYYNGFYYGFVDGADWRINSIWHTMDEEPQVYGKHEGKVSPQIPCLVLGHLSTGYGYGVRYWNATYKVWDDEECDDYECGKDSVEKWCYLDDLLPTKENE